MHQRELGASLQITFQTEGSYYLRSVHFLWDTGEASLGVVPRLIMGCLGKGPKAGKGREQGALGRSQHRKTEVKEGKRGQSHVDSLLISMLV